MEGLCQSSPSRHHGRRTARADTETAVLLAGPGTVINTSDAGGELTAEARTVIRCWLVCRLPIMCSGVASADAAPSRSDCQFGATPAPSPDNRLLGRMSASADGAGHRCSLFHLAVLR